MAVLCWLMEATPLRWLGYLCVLYLSFTCELHVCMYRPMLCTVSTLYLLAHCAVKMYVNNDCPALMALAALDVVVFHVFATVMAGVLAVWAVHWFMRREFVRRAICYYKLNGAWTPFVLSLLLLVMVHSMVDDVVTQVMDETLRLRYPALMQRIKDAQPWLAQGCTGTS